MALRFIHTSDWHLGAPIGWGDEKETGLWIDRARRLRQDAVGQIVELAQTNDVAAILVAGDVLDQPKLPAAIHDQAATFLREQVVEPLKRAGVRLLLTPGTHDWREGDTSSLALLSGLAAECPEWVGLIMAKPTEGIRAERGLEVGGFSVAAEAPPTRGAAWIQFVHEPRPYRGVQPAYRAFGDGHRLKCCAKNAWQPGAPFARSSAADNYHTDAGARFVMVVDITREGTKPRPVRLSVPEVAVLRKKRDASAWTLFHSWDSKCNGVAKEEWTEPSAIVAVSEGIKRLRSAGDRSRVLTLVFDRHEGRVPAQAVLSDVGSPHSISASDKGRAIVSLWLEGDESPGPGTISRSSGPVRVNIEGPENSRWLQALR